MFWLSEETFSRSVSIHWQREELPLPSPTDGAGKVGKQATTLAADDSADSAQLAKQEEFFVSGALWRQMGQLHYVSYLESDEGDRITLKLEPTRLTWIRHGSVEWNPVFELGQQHHSAMVLGGTSLPVETNTSELTIHVEPSGGTVSLAYELLIGDWPQRVRLQVRFEVEQAESN